MAFLGGLFGGDEGGAELPPAPEYYLNPDFKSSQEALKGYYGGVMQGNLPEYYKPIGESGGDEFDKIMSDITSRITTNVSRSVDEGLSRGGISDRDGLAAATKSMAVAKATGDIEAEFSLMDYERAMNSRGNLFGLGLSGIESIGKNALGESSLRNQFNLGTYSTALSNYATMSEEEEKEGDFFSQLMGKTFELGGDYLAQNKTKNTTGGTSYNSAPGWGSTTARNTYGNTTAMNMFNS